MDRSSRTNSLARQRSRRASITEMDIHTFSAHNAVAQSTPQTTSSAEEIDLNKRVAKAAELYMAFVSEQELSTASPAWWPTAGSRAANLYLVSSGEGITGAARLVRTISSSVIFMASLMSCLGSIDCGDNKCEELPAWLQAEMLFLGFFTVEYFTRLLTAHARPTDDQANTLADGTKERASLCGSTCSWMRQWMNIVDLVSILPFYIEELVNALTAGGEQQPGPYQIVRILRILRVLRVIKLAEVSDSMTLFGRGIKRSRDYIITLSLTLVIITILFASFIFHAESGTTAVVVDRGDSAENDRQKPPPSSTAAAVPVSRPQAGVNAEDAEEDFLNVPDVFWFCVSEITTVGNASKSPVTVTGQALAIILACFGVFYLSFAQAVIVNSFQEVLREHARTDNGGKQLKRIFDAQPKDAHGRVRCKDVHRALRRHDPALALALEPFLALDDMPLRNQISSQGGTGGNDSTPEKVGSIDYAFFAALMHDARDKRTAQGGDTIVDMESIAMSVELIKEDQDLLREEMHTFFTEQASHFGHSRFAPFQRRRQKQLNCDMWLGTVRA